MENDGGLVKVDNLIAISEELFPHVALGYMNSEHYAVDKFTTTVDEIHEAHQTRENSLKDQFSRFGKQAEDLTKMMEANFHGICQKMQDERDTLKGKLEDERKVILERAKLSEQSDQLRFQAARLVWYEAKLKGTEEVKLQLQQGLEVAKNSARIPAETEELLK